MISEYSVVENPSMELWKSFLNMFPEGNLEQCYEYGEIAKMAFPSTKVVRLAIVQHGEVMGILQGTYSSYLGFGMELGVTRGPVINIKNKDSFQLIENLTKALENYGKKRRIIHVQFLVPEAWRLREVFQNLGYNFVGKLNEYVVNLEKGVDELWKGIDHNKRRNIKKAAKEGVEVIQSHDYRDLHAFYSMLKAAEERAGFSSYPLSWFEAVWKIYKPDCLSSVFLARWRGKNVSGVFTVIHGKTVYALAAGSLRGGWKVRPNDIMHWKVMEWACQRGYSGYYMGLVSDPPPTESSGAWGIWRWKREWKGDLKGFQIFDRLLLPRYKFILDTKKLVEKSYNSLKRLR